MINGKPVVIDGYCGLGGWTEGFLAERWTCIGIDIERHDYGTGGYPGHLILQDMLTVHGGQFKDADCLVFSPPCQEFSYMAMPWHRAKQIAKGLRGTGDFPAGYRGSRTVKELTALFDACFRIQREASAAAGRHIPMVIENVRGAQPWVGKARANYGSFYLWGDVPALMPHPQKARKVPSFRFDGSGRSFQSASVDGVKAGGSWSGYGEPGYVAKSFHQLAAAREGLKVTAIAHRRDGHSHTRHLTNQAEHDAVKGFKDFHDSPICHFGSKSNARKAASAQIAKIPFRLSSHIARWYKPEA